jgi:hypothetical protein
MTEQKQFLKIGENPTFLKKMKRLFVRRRRNCIFSSENGKGCEELCKSAAFSWNTALLFIN